MRNIYVCMFFLIVAKGLSAQVGTVQLAPKSATFELNANPSYSTSFEKVTIWSNDISDSTDWTFTNTSSPAQDWYIETDPTAVPNNGPVAMTTASNGFLMINSDLAGAGASQNAYATYTGGPINLTGQPDVLLEFEQHYRRYLDERYIDVSNNGGQTWTTFTITDGTEMGVTVVSGVYSVDISSVAGNQSNVTIRFHYIGDWAWHWAVDDIRIKTIEPYDLKAESNAWGVTGSWAPLGTPLRLPYHKTPVAQIQPIEFCGIMSNIGLNDIINATYSVAIPSANFSSSETISSAVGVTDTVCIPASFTPTGIDSFEVYSGLSTTSPDTVVSNNIFDDISFTIDPFLYARDNSDVSIDGGTSNHGEGFETGNIFDIYTDANLYTIRAGVHENSVPGTLVYVKLYSFNAAGNLVLEDESGSYALLASDLGSFIDIELSNGAFPLIAGESYLVTVGSNGNGGTADDLVVMNSGVSQRETTYFYDESITTWFFSTATSAVQMNFDPSSTSFLDENSKNFGITVYPNPASTDANISFTLNNASDVNIVVTDLSGKVIESKDLGKVAAGSKEVKLSTAVLSEGVYLIYVRANNATSTEKMIINK